MAARLGVRGPLQDHMMRALHDIMSGGGSWGAKSGAVSGRSANWHPNHEQWAQFEYSKGEAGAGFLALASGTATFGCDEEEQSVQGGIITADWTHNATIVVNDAMSGTIKIDGGALGERPVNVEEAPPGSDHYHLLEKTEGLLLASVQFVIPSEIN